VGLSLSYRPKRLGVHEEVLREPNLDVQALDS